jgi:hypothetical protein
MLCTAFAEPDQQSRTLTQTTENNMQGYGLYFIVVGIFGIVMALARARNEREVFLILATIPTALLVVRVAEFLRKRNKK